MNNDLTLSAKISGRFKFQVIEKGVVVEDRPWQENMVLNNFLDALCTARPQDGFDHLGIFIRYHVIGTGSAAVSATDTALQNESKRTGTWLTGSGNLGTSWSGATQTWRQTFDHTEEVSNVNYTEHGLAPSATSNTGVYTRALISGGTLTVLAGQQARCIYDVSITYSPNVLTGITVGGTGWPVSPATDCDGDIIISLKFPLVGEMETDGSYTNGTVLIGGSTKIVAPYIGTMTLDGFGLGGTGSGPGAASAITYTNDSYVVGSFTRTSRPSAYATPTSWSSTQISGWSIGSGAIRFKYDQYQTKANTHKLRYPSFTITWSR